MFFLKDEISFPKPELANEDGLLAIGGDLRPERILLAYRMGIFPWYDEDPILWWSPDPRFVLFPEELRIAKAVRPLLNRQAFTFTINKAFHDVILNCRHMPRPGQDGTWINPDMVAAYTKLHEMGWAVSAEVWNGDALVGGLYGLRIGKVFFGESMFSKVSNASRYAFIKWVEWLKTDGVELIDCQVYTEYLQSFGARMIEGKEFRELLKKLV